MRIHLPSKKILHILILTLIPVLAGLYAWQSVGAWQKFESRLTGEKETYEKLKFQALEGDSPEARIKAVRALDDKVASRSELCRMNNFYAWQSGIVPVIRAGVERCEATTRLLETLSIPLRELRNYVDAVEKVQSVVGSLAYSENLNEQNWREQGLARAKQAQKAAEELTGHGDVAKLNDQTKQVTGELVKAWEALILAHTNKDKAAFEVAKGAVLKAYADLTGLADTADAAIQQKADVFIKTKV
jgi:hypothetical protein